MNIKDPLHPYEDTRKEDIARTREAMKKKKLVYQCTYELVMGHIPHKLTKSLSASKPLNITRAGGATLNGRAL